MKIVFDQTDIRTLLQSKLGQLENDVHINWTQSSVTFKPSKYHNDTQTLDFEEFIDITLDIALTGDDL